MNGEIPSNVGCGLLHNNLTKNAGCFCQFLLLKLLVGSSLWCENWVSILRWTNLNLGVKRLLCLNLSTILALHIYCFAIS